MNAFIYQILSDSDTYKFIVLMSDGLSTDRKDATDEAESFTMSPYHIIICIGDGARVDHLELIQLASRDDSGIYGPMVFPSSTQDSINMIAKLTMRKDCASKFYIKDFFLQWIINNNMKFVKSNIKVNTCTIFADFESFNHHFQTDICSLLDCNILYASDVIIIQDNTVSKNSNIPLASP